MAERVFVGSCSDYNLDEIKKILAEGLKTLELDPRLFFAGKSCTLKPNLLIPKKPEQGVTTHPTVIQAMAELVLENEGQVVIGDTPGGPFNKPYLKALYKTTQMEKASLESDGSLNYDTEEVDTPFPSGNVMKRVGIARFIKDGDLLINMAKMKTHGLTRMTGGVKNLFGAVPGMQKTEYHMKMNEINHFSTLLVDIARLLNPPLTIIDGIHAMEGNGPSSGTIKKAGKIIMAKNVFAADVVMARIMGISPLQIPTIKVAKDLDLPGDLTDVEVFGDMGKEKFIFPQGKREITLFSRIFPKKWVPRIHNVLQAVPVFDRAKCVGCGICARHCPPKVISGTEDKNPKIDLDGCIRCFCCQELCPYEAIKIYRPLLGRIIFR